MMCGPGRHAVRGFTLVELMVGLAVGAAVVTTALAALSLPLREATAAQRAARAAEDLRAADLLMHRLLRQTVPTPTGEPALQIEDGGALLRARSADADGVVRGVAWRLVEGSLAMRYDGGAWQLLTDPRALRLRALQFTLVPQAPDAAPGPGRCGSTAAPAVEWRFEHRAAPDGAGPWSVASSRVQVRHRWPAVGCAS
jgi:prepilin-type N-terminal cleavage/methylation domain-containing protein